MKNIIKNLSGKVLCIGLDNKYSSLIQSNSNITECNMLNNYEKKSKGKKSRGKSIDIKKIKKHFKKKNIDYIICNYKVIKPYLKSFIKNSIYINKSKIYFFDYEEAIIKKYARYGSVINKKEILEIDNTNIKTNFIRDFIFSITDLFSVLIEIIGDVLMN